MTLKVNGLLPKYPFRLPAFVQQAVKFLITSMPGTGTTNDENIRTLTGIFM
jgi:hypothetical protein